MNKIAVMMLVAIVWCCPRCWCQRYNQTGTATYYGKEFQGQLTASGERYDSRKLTAAHRTLPLNSYVSVTNLENGRQVVLRINDRNYNRNTIVDVSDSAARQLRFHRKGVAYVRVVYLNQPSNRPNRPNRDQPTTY